MLPRWVFFFGGVSGVTVGLIWLLFSRRFVVLSHQDSKKRKTDAAVDDGDEGYEAPAKKTTPAPKQANAPPPGKK